MKPIKIFGFNGMNNLNRAGSAFTDANGIASPFIALNVDVVEGACIKKRGYTKVCSLSGAHSLFSNNEVMLCVAKAKLYKIVNDKAIELCSCNENTPMYYVDYNNVIYMSNGYWSGVYDNGEIRQWGVNLPPCPQLRITDGNLFPGKYSVCYTKINEKGIISGNGEIAQIEFTNTAGIELLNYDNSFLCWITDANGDIFHLAEVQNNKITDKYYNQILPSLYVIPPKPMKHLTEAFGRIWGSYHKSLYFSEPLSPEWFKEANRFDFPEEINMIAPVKEGIYINSKYSTWVLWGTDPNKMEIRRIGIGAVENSLVYAEVEESGREIPTWRHKTMLPVWLSRKGFVAGTQHARLVNLTEEIVNIGLGRRAAALARKINGYNQLIVTMSSPFWGDGSLNQIFKNGTLN